MQFLILNTKLKYGHQYTFANRYEFTFNSKTNVIFRGKPFDMGGGRYGGGWKILFSKWKKK